MKKNFYLTVFSIFIIGFSFFFDFNDFFKVIIFSLFMIVMAFVIVKTKND